MPGACHQVLGTCTHWYVNIEVLDHLGSIGGCDPGVAQAIEEYPHLFVRGLLGALRAFHSFAPVIIGVDHLAPPVVPLTVNIMRLRTPCRCAARLSVDFIRE